MRPLPGGSKILFDAGIKDGKAGLAAVALTDDGDFIKAICTAMPGITDPMYAEARALELALDLANERGADEWILAGDCLGLIRMIREMEPPAGTCHSLVIELQKRVGEAGIGLPFWIPRSSNILAHSLATYAKENINASIEWNSPPSFFLSNDSGRFPVT